MIARFWLASLLFHLGAVCAAVWIARRWRQPKAEALRRIPWWAAILEDLFRFGLALWLLAVLAGVVAWTSAMSPVFTMARFLCQGLFGEGVLMATWLAGIHFVRRQIARGTVLALLAGSLLATYVEAYHHGPRNLQVLRHPLDRARGRAGTRTLRILHLSDIQTHQIGSYEARSIRAAAALAPDLIVFTGDYIQERLAPTYAEAGAAFNALMRREGLRAPLGFFALEGDVDDPGEWLHLFQGLGVTYLVNQHARVRLPNGRSLALIGLDAWMSRGNDPEALLEIVDAAPPADLRIVAGHAPDFVRALAGRRAIDLALAGHTHGGQVVLPFLGPVVTLSRLPRRYAGGMRDYQDIPLHVSRGIGMERHTAPQIRFLCPPEICVIELRY